MKQCQFCGASLPADAGFCGVCGRASHRESEQTTYSGNVPTILIAQQPATNTPTLPVSRNAFSAFDHDPLAGMHPMNLAPLEEEEEKRRSAALLGFGLPLSNQQAPHQIPTIQGTPQIAHVPTISGTPQMGHVPTISGTPSIPNTPSSPGHMPSQQPTYAGHHHYGGHGPGTHPHPHPGSSGGSTSGTAGCLTLGLILLAAVAIILASIVGLGLTVWAPGLALSGSSTVAPGGTLSLQGSHFLPNSNVTLTLDNAIPLIFAQHAASANLAYNDNTSTQNMGQVLSAFRSPLTTNVITVSGDGSFSVTIAVNRIWSVGQHTIHAAESASHRSASLTFTIGQPAIPTSTATATPTSPATPTPATLSCATPGVLSLGPVSELSSQIVTGNVALCTSGSGTLTWSASWNQNQASWLQLPTANGTIQAPNEVGVTVNASAAKLSAGTYIATLTFTSQESNSSQTIEVQLTVQTGCINATPPSLAFSGVEGSSDPAPQSISITNCALSSDWFAQTTNNSNWLTISPSQGTLNNNETSTITMTVSNQNAGLQAGTYNDTIVITLGSQTINVSVTLTVQPPPTLSVSTSNLNAHRTPCTDNPDGTESCPVTLSNNSSDASLTWSFTTNSSNVTVQTQDGAPPTIAPGGTQQVTIVIAPNACAIFTITFTGPANSVDVVWNCQIIS